MSCTRGSSRVWEVNPGELLVLLRCAQLVLKLLVFLCFSSGTVMSVRLTTCMLSTWKTPWRLSTSQTSPRTNASPGQSVLFHLFSSLLLLFSFLFPEWVIILLVLRQSENQDHTSNQIKSLLCTPIRNGKKDKVIGMTSLPVCLSLVEC